jgi:hypothetical protein
MHLTIVCPTIDGREESFARMLASYEATIPANVDVDFISPRNCRTWGEGVVRGMAEAGRLQYVHLTADDLEALPGWFEAGRETVVRGMYPAPLLDTFGEIAYGHPPTPDMSDWKDSQTSVIPFMTQRMWFAMMDQNVGEVLADLHYYSDNLMSHALRQAGVKTVGRTGYRFNHHHEMHGRGAGMGTQDARMQRDGIRFEQWLREET